jgi:CelD/BcsL family acetyltransferase involved in cellulose biosynthesis
MLNNVPSWAGYLPLLEKCKSKSKVFWQNLHYSVSPAIVADTPEQLFKMVDRNRKHRYYFTRLTKQLNAEFEVLENNEDMEGWANEFCNTHIKRWEKTATPSYFKNKAYQQFLLGCLQAWQKDNVLVRFAIKVNQQRIGFSISLLDQNSLIGHSTTYDPDFEKYSPGKSLILPMAKWITEKHLTKFDFGDGNEKYKYLFINKEQVLNRIMISGKNNIRFILKAKSIRMVRNNAYLYKLYRNTFKRMLAP